MLGSINIGSRLSKNSPLYTSKVEHTHIVQKEHHATRLIQNFYYGSWRVCFDVATNI